MEIPILKDIIIIVGLGIIVLLVFSRLKISPIVGFLLTGIIAGPHGFALVSAQHEVEIMAEIGVILLLFSLGIEFSFRRLMELRHAVFIGGTFQVTATFLAVTGVSYALGAPLPSSVFYGFLVALSSTAIVLKHLQETAAVATPHGRTSVGILIFQDVVVVPMMMITPFLGNMDRALKFSPNQVLGDLMIYSVYLILLLVFIYISTKWLVPFIFFHVSKTRSRELFVMSVAFLAFAIAWMTSQMGLSLALGAFLAGLIVSESEYSHDAIANILPMRDLFMSFFFVSIGMLLDITIVYSQVGMVLVFALGILSLKFLTGGFATAFLQYPFRTILLVALSLAQIGEFSFILLKVGLQNDLISNENYQMFLSVAIVTMMATPFLMALGKYASRITAILPLPERLKKGGRPDELEVEGGLDDHLIIIGYGLNGKNLARVAEKSEIPYVVIDMNPRTVRMERKQGVPIFYGDATHTDVLKHAFVEKSRIMVIAINDPAATRRIVRVARRINQNLHLIVRTRFVNEVSALFTLGADEIIPEEFETSIEIFTLVLRKYLVPNDIIDELAGEVRAHGYELLCKECVLERKQ